MNARQIRFCHEYIKDRNGTAAARRAGYTGTQASLGTMASAMLKKVEVKAMIADAEARRLARTGVKADEVLRKLMAVAFADPRKLVEYRRRCCRNCWGVEFGYQMTEEEDEERRKQHEREVARFAQAKEQEEFDDPGEYDPRGGTGYDPRKLPHEECPKCDGEGVSRTYVHDTDTYDEDALALYAGIKKTKDGIEVVMNSQDRAREMLGKHLKLFVDQVEHTGKVDLMIVTGVPHKDEAAAPPEPAPAPVKKGKK